jgi:hypothetical protein
MRARVSVGAPGTIIWASLTLAASGASAEPSRRSEVVWVDPVADMAPGHLLSNHVSPIIYVNPCRGGCSFTPGGNDSRDNTVSFIQGPVTVTEFEHDQATYDAVIACVREVYRPYDVEIVTADPGNDNHHEAILAGSPEELGLGSAVGGIAPAACSPLNNAISFSFSNNGADVLTMCWTVAQESAHTFGLPDHVFECSDAMTYLQGCGQKYFRDRVLPCGEFESGDTPCRCNDAGQNSHQQLLAAFGPGKPPEPPEVTIALPMDGADVADDFSIHGFATDPRLVSLVELFINGSKYDELPGHPFEQRDDNYFFSAPEHADGYMTIELRAANDLGSAASASVRVLKGEPCQSDDQCLNEQFCEDGACTYPPATRGLGDRCDHDQQCISARCEGGDGSRCTHTCDPELSDSCEAGFECLDTAGSGLCWPSGGGCCSVASPRSAGDFAVAAIAALLSAVLLRRRRGGSI